MNKKFFPLALGGLGIGTTEFVIMGLLPNVAASLKISIPEAGYLISAYALGVVIGAPLLVAFASKYPPKKVLIALMVMFTFFNGISAIAPEFYSLLIARFFSGLPHGAFFGVGAIVASRMAKPGKQAQAISMIFTGLTIANLAMVPLVTWVGNVLNWRFAFGIVALLGAATILFLQLWLPPMKALRSTGLKEEMQFFKTRQSWLIIAITAIGFGGLFAWFSYIAPLMMQVSGFSQASMSYIMVLAGAGMVIGNIVGGWMADNMQPVKAAAFLYTLLAISLLAVFLFSGNPAVSLVFTFVCGTLSMTVGTPVNVLMLRTAKKSEMMAAAIMQAAFNVANSIGAFLGGIPIKMGLGYQYPSLVGAIMALTGLGLCFVFMKKYILPGPSANAAHTESNVKLICTEDAIADCN